MLYLNGQSIAFCLSTALCSHIMTSTGPSSFREEGRLAREDPLVIQAFTELAPRYEETVDYELRLFWGVGYREFITRLIRMANVQREDVVLDVATGTAVIPQEMLAGGIGARVVGLDITPGMLQGAQEHLRQRGLDGMAELVCGSGMHMPLAAGTFDVVICGLGTHHMDVPRLLAEVARVLKPGGRFVMADVCATPFWRSLPGQVLLRSLLVYYGWKVRRAPPHEEQAVEAVGLSMSPSRAQAEIEAFHNLMTPAEWVTRIRMMGFDDIEIEEIKALRRIFPGGLIMKAVRGPR